MGDAKHNLRAIFNKARERSDPRERDEYLEGACGGDRALRHQVEDLIRAHEHAADFLKAEPRRSFDSPIGREGAPSDAPLDESAGSIIGRCKVLQRIGEGGVGVVYMAEQMAPVRRRVALKIIKPGMDTKQVIARFEAERQALAMMDHPNIAKVFDAGATDSGRPFFVMELVRGIPVTRYCVENKLTTHESLELFIPICQAIQHAHQKGIIHRDIKPSNVLVTLDDGAPAPKVIDFGIAKATQQKLTAETIITLYNQFVGTPAYMSPEQAELSGLDIDTRSDIYSLGILLYELLTGSTPFDTRELTQSGLDEMRKIIREREPIKPSTRLRTTSATQSSPNPATLHSPRVTDLATDLDWIVMKCLEKDRTRRYETANGLAFDIKRHLNDEPVVARPPSVAYKLWKAWRRNRIVYTAGVGAAAALVIGSSISIWQATEARRARDAEAQLRMEAVDARKEAQTQERLAHRRAYAADMNRVQRNLEIHKFGEALDLLNRYRPQPGEEDIRGWEWRYLWKLGRSDAFFRLAGTGKWTSALSVSYDSRWLSVTHLNRRWFIMDIAARHEASPPWLDAAHRAVVFSQTEPIAAVVLIESDDLWIIDLINIENGQRRTRIGPLPRSSPLKVTFSRDGSTLAAFAAPGPNAIRLWRVADGSELASHPWSGDQKSGAFALSSDGSMLATAGSKNRPEMVRVIDSLSGETIWENKGSDIKISKAAFSPDSTILVSGGAGNDNVIRVWDAETGELQGILKGHRSYITGFQFLDGKGATLASASADHTIRLWDVEEMKQFRVLMGHREEVSSLAAMPDGSTLLSGSFDGEILGWKPDSTEFPKKRAIVQNRPPAVSLQHRPPIGRSKNRYITNKDWSFAADGRSILAFDTDKRIIQWSSPRFDQAEIVCNPGTGLVDFVFSNDGRYGVGVSGAGEIVLWNLHESQAESRLIKRQPDTDLIALSVEKNRLIANHHTDNHGTLQVIDLRSGKVQKAHPLEAREYPFVISPDGRWTMTWMRTRNPLELHLIDLDADTLNAVPFPFPYGANWGAFSHDNRFVAISSEPHVTRGIEFPSGKPAFSLKGHLNGPKIMAFSPDTRRLATGSIGPEVMKIWDFEHRFDLLTLEGQGQFSSPAQFSLNGNLLGAMNTSGEIHIWSAPSWEEIEADEAEGL